jgi:hypothetical protein
MLIVDENGDLVEVRSTPKPMMQVRVRGTTATWPHLSTEFETVDVPEGCVVQDLLGYLTFSNRKFQIAFPHGTLRATIRGEQCQPMRVLMPNDEVVVSGHPDPQLSRLMAKLLTPLP